MARIKTCSACVGAYPEGSRHDCPAQPDADGPHKKAFEEHQQTLADREKMPIGMQPIVSLDAKPQCV